VNSRLLRSDVETVLSWIPPVLHSAMVEVARRGHPTYLAGGAIRDLCTEIEPIDTVQDYDVFGTLAGLQGLDAALRERGQVETSGERAAGISLKLRGEPAPIQLIVGNPLDFGGAEVNPHTLRKGAEALLDRFDFRSCCAAIWYAPGLGWDSGCDDAFYADVAARRLVYRAPSRIDSIDHMLRLVRRGWTVDAENLAAVLARFVANGDEVAETLYLLDFTARLQKSRADTRSSVGTHPIPVREVA
jgi:hypothetical protein